MFIAINGKLAGIIAVADVLKESSRRAIDVLHRMGIEVVMITGDNKKTEGNCPAGRNRPGAGRSAPAGQSQ